MNSKREDELCEDIILHVLRTKLKSDFKLLSYDINSADVSGVMGEYKFLTTKTELHGLTRKDSFFVKTFPVNEFFAGCAERACYFEKEMFVYELLKNSVAAPECYHASKRMMVMEDLEVEGYEALERIVNSVDVIKVVIASLVEFHAASIIAQEHHPNFSEEFERTHEDTLYNEKLQSCQNHLKAGVNGLVAAVDLLKLDGGIKETIAKHVSKIFKLTRPSRKYRNVIVHGDLWPANILVKYADGKPKNCKIIDFQLIRSSPPAQDLMSLLFLSTTREFRRRYEADLVKFYYSSLAESLEAKGVCVANFVREDEFLDSCEEQKGFGIIQAADYFMLIMLGKEAKAKLLEDSVVSAKAFTCDKSLMFPFAGGDEVYFDRIKESILDIVDYFEM